MTRQEFDEAFDGQHVELACEDHPHMRWSCKRIALSEDAGGKFRWNGSRHLFFKGVNDGHETKPSIGPECDCSWTKLFAVIEA